MAETRLNDSKSDESLTMDHATTPLWNKERGQRMAIHRMKMLQDQKTVALDLGMTQPSYSKLERGTVRVTDRITLADMKRVFGTSGVSYILFGTYSDRYNRAHIMKVYWRTRLRESHKRKFGDRFGQV